MHIRPPFIRLIAALIFVGSTGLPAFSTPPDPPGQKFDKLDAMLQKRASKATGRTRVIVRARRGVAIDALAGEVQRTGGRAGRLLRSINSRVVDMPNGALAALARNPAIERISVDREVVGAMERTAATIGVTSVRENFGYDGTGVGVAVIDSGVAPSHDDLVSGNSRVAAFVDFVNGAPAAYDDYGHGTHVAGIVAGNGFDSDGARAGIAPGSDLIVLKALDANGRGRTSDVIAALEYAVANKDALNIRVVNLSVATGVFESYNTDPLTVAAREAVEAGLVVVAAAGNNGRDAQGRFHHGGITAPGNAPWVLTVGGSSHMGTTDRSDDTIAPFSSRGPSAIDYTAKPDVVAPGVGIESLSDPEGTLYSTHSPYLLPGVVATSYLPYLSLSGTSMSAPVVSGTVALMLQANPSLTPNEVKAIVQYTSQFSRTYDPLTQGAGFLNARGAVELSRYLASPSTVAYPSSKSWGKRLVWGNRMVQGGRLSPAANAWTSGAIWGAASTPGGEDIEWGVLCSWSTCDSSIGLWRSSTTKAVNVVWGPACGGDDCTTEWTGGAVYGTTDDGDTVVWGTADEGDTVVWGTADDGDTVVWGTTDDGDTVVWGTSCSDPACEPVIWKTP